MVTACANKTTKEATETKGGGQASAAPSGEQAKRVDKALVRFVNATAVLAVDQKDGKPALNAINDDLAAPSAAHAKVRVVNAAPTLADVDLYGADKKSALISGAGFNHATDYKDIEPTTSELVVRDAANKHREAVLQDMRLEAGKLYTLLIVGGKGAHLTAETIEDQLVPPSPQR